MIGLRPGDVTEKDQDGLLAILYGNKLPRLRKPSLVGEIERISKIKCLFEKGYVPNWSEEHFHIKSWIRKRKQVFKLADDLLDDIKGEFYEEELEPIEDNRYVIERIIRKRKTPQGNQEFLVK